MRKGIAKKTEHEDGNGDLRCLSTYFEQQWLVEGPEWYLACGHDGRARVAATNNACEAAVKYVRLDAGDGVIVNLADNVAFLQRVVRSQSMDDWVPKAKRDVAVAVWPCAQSFLGVVRSNLVYRDNTNPAAVRYVVWGRRSAHVLDDRKRMLPAQPRKILETLDKLQGGHMHNVAVTHIICAHRPAVDG